MNNFVTNRYEQCHSFIEENKGGDLKSKIKIRFRDFSFQIHRFGYFGQCRKFNIFTEKNREIGLKKSQK